MNKCEHNTRVNHRYGGHYKVRCKKDAKMQDENGRLLCKHHFNKWFKKVYKEDYDTFINAEI